MAQRKKRLTRKQRQELLGKGPSGTPRQWPPPMADESVDLSDGEVGLMGPDGGLMKSMIFEGAVDGEFEEAMERLMDAGAFTPVVIKPNAHPSLDQNEFASSLASPVDSDGGDLAVEFFAFRYGLELRARTEGVPGHYDAFRDGTQLAVVAVGAFQDIDDAKPLRMIESNIPGLPGSRDPSLALLEVVSKVIDAVPSAHEDANIPRVSVLVNAHETRRPGDLKTALAETLRVPVELQQPLRSARNKVDLFVWLEAIAYDEVEGADVTFFANNAAGRKLRRALIETVD